MCVEKNESIVGRDTHTHNVTAISNISGFERVQHCVDFMNQSLVTAINSSHNNYMYNDVTTVQS